MNFAERYPGVPVFRFGSEELEKFHEYKWSEYYVPVYHSRELGRIRVANRYEQYIVDHGGFFTLNTLRAGQCAVGMKDIKEAL